MPNLRPRFSLRTLLVLVTLVCVYFGCWEITKRHGLVLTPEAFEDDIWATSVSDMSSPMPFIVGFTEQKVRKPNELTITRRHFVWLFGWTLETPIRWEMLPWWAVHTITGPENVQLP